MTKDELIAELVTALESADRVLRGPFDGSDLAAVVAKVRTALSHAHAAQSDDESAKHSRLLDAADDLLTDIENPRTPAEARLALAVYDLRPGSLGKENCQCEDRDSCDECLSTADCLSYLHKVATRDDPAPPSKQEGA